MEREILFRGKDRNGDWWFGAYRPGNDGKDWIMDGQYHVVDPKSVSQYIGIDDVKGRKVFEKMRVRVSFRDPETGNLFPGSYIVAWHCHGFMLFGRYGWQDIGDEDDVWEIEEDGPLEIRQL